VIRASLSSTDPLSAAQASVYIDVSRTIINCSECKTVRETALMMKRISILLFLCFLAAALSVGCSSGQEVNTQTKATDSIYNANNNIIVEQTDYTDDEGTYHPFTYSWGFDGVVFKQENDRYYILTVYHALDDLSDDMQLVVIGFDDLTYGEYTEKNNVDFSAVSPLDYYSDFPRAVVEYYDKSNDLAILSFESTKEINLAQFSGSPIEVGEEVYCISSPEGNERDLLSEGRILATDKDEKFDDGSDISGVFLHSCYIDHGSSGSAVYNKSDQIVGINVGGATGIFGRFKYGMAVPSEKINSFLAEWENDAK
jgi:serine protease Do